MERLNKAQIRAEAIRRRNALSDEERAMKSLAICEKVMQDERFLDARGIHVYLPVRSEVDIKPLISIAWDMEKTVGLMRVDREGGSRHYAIRPETEYQVGSLGILEPIDAVEFDMEQCDLVVVPLVAVDLQCNRIGYGKGYYDQFLSQFPRPTVGVAFDTQIFAQLPSEVFDIALDSVVSESRTLPCED